MCARAAKNEPFIYPCSHPGTTFSLRLKSKKGEMGYIARGILSPNPALYADYRGEIVADRYGRKIPKHAHGTVNLKTRTSSSRKIMEAVMGLYDDIVNPKLLVRRITLVGNRLVEEARAEAEEQYEQLELFTDTGGQEEEKKQEELRLKKERSLQEVMLSVKKKYGKNAMLKGMNLQEGATAMERNSQIGGHKA